MTSTLAERILTAQLDVDEPLPEPLLRAAGRLAGDVEVAERLAWRLDLPADLRAVLAADSRSQVRSAFASRGDVETEELVSLLGTESRSAVLAAVAKGHLDQTLHELLWQRVLAKPTKTLAVALMHHLVYNYRHPHRGPVTPGPVLLAACSALGDFRTLSRSTRHYLTVLGTDLTAGSQDSGTAEMLAASPEVPDGLRARLLGSKHLSSATRIAVLTDCWLQPLRGAADHRMFTFAYRGLHLPDRVDALELLLLCDDVPADVLSWVGTTLVELRGVLPSGSVQPWQEMLDGYKTGVDQASCVRCHQRAVEQSQVWPGAGYELPQRNPRRTRQGRGLVQSGPSAADVFDAAMAERAGSQTHDADPEVQDSEQLSILDDSTLAHRVRDDLDRSRFAAVLHITAQRESVVLACALLSRPDLPADDATRLLDASWFTPAGEVLVSLVEARRDPAFALAAAGLAPQALLTAFTPAVFSALAGDAGERDGAVAFARQAGSALTGTRTPGWGAWAQATDPLGSPGVVWQLVSFVEHRCVEDAVLLELPWWLLTAMLGHSGPMQVTTNWPPSTRGRVSAVLAAATARALGESTLAWDAYLSMSDTFTGTGAQLLASAAAVAAAAG